MQAKEDLEERTHPPTAPIRPTVQISSAPEGGTQFYFPAGHNLSAALGVTFFLFLFGGAQALIFYLHAPLIFAIFFGFFVFLLLIITLNLWFGTARIVANADGVSLHTNMLGFGGSQKWAASQIQSVRPKITMQSGGGGKGIPYYTVTIIDSTGRENAIGNALSDHNEAEWIC